MGTVLDLLSRRGPAGEVGYPGHREEQVEHYHQDDEEAHHDHERPPRRAVRRFFVQPGDREQQDDEQRRYYHVTEGYQRRAGEVDQPLVQEEEEPLRPGNVGRRAEVHRLGQRDRQHVGEDHDDRQEDGRDGEVRHDLTREEPLGLVIALEDVLLGYYLSLFNRLRRTAPNLHHSLFDLSQMPHAGNHVLTLARIHLPPPTWNTLPSAAGPGVPPDARSTRTGRRTPRACAAGTGERR